MVINENDYRNLCACADRIFKEATVDDGLIATPYMHIIRAHPVLLEKYAPILAGTGIKQRRNLKQIVASLHSLAARHGISFTSRAGGQGIADIGPSITTPDFLFVSHLLKPDQANNEPDLYFGDLPNNLHRSGFSVAISYVNQTTHDVRQLTGQWANDGVTRYLVGRTCAPNEARDCLDQMAATASALESLASGNSGNPLYASFCKAAANDARSNTTWVNLAIGRNFRELLSHIKPKVVIFTHEGHAWERVICAETNRQAPSAVRAGYIHAALFDTQHCLFTELPLTYHPDKVFTTGKLALEQLRDRTYFLADQAAILGTHKITRSTAIAGDKQNDCLVLPEGLVEECRYLFGCSLALARKHPHVRFVWRLHPILSFDTLTAAYPEFRNLPANIELSGNSFEHDISRSKWALYRGSTAIVQALAGGVQPLYMRQPGGLDVDPLHQLYAWKKIIDHPGMLDSVFMPDKSGETDNLSLAEAKKFVDRFYEPFRQVALTELLSGKYVN